MIIELIYLTIPTLILVGMLFLIDRLRWQAVSLPGSAPVVSYNTPLLHSSTGVRTMLRYFISKRARNQAWRQLTDEEKAEHCRRFHRNLVLHPTKVEDYEGALNGDKDYGNEIPMEKFSKIYSIEPRPPEF